MFYSSGNFDTDVFSHPERLDLSRNPNPHVGFGGGGVHFCLGANLARAQLRAIFGELLHQLPDIQAGDPAFRGRQLHPRHPQHALHVLVHDAGESSSASSVSSSEQPPSTLTPASSSPRVGPRLTMATGMPRAAA